MSTRLRAERITRVPNKENRMPTYSYDHIHLRSLDPIATARYFNEMFDAEIIESIQSDGQPRIDLDINGLTIFIAKADEDTPAGPVDPHLGLDHFGLRVDDLDEAAADLKSKGADSPPSRSSFDPASRSHS